MSDTDLKNSLLTTAHEAAAAARNTILPYFRGGGLSTENKDEAGGFDPVTLADREAEAAMRAVILRMRPRDAILGEEEGATSGTSGLTWVLDPIDGTRAFICGTASWGVLISVENDDGPILGVIDQPYTQERFVGGMGERALLTTGGSRELKTKTTDALSDALLMTTFPEVGSPEERERFERVRDRVKLTRYGLDCYAYALLALGQIDLVIEAGLHRYDISAPVAVIEAAGGVVTDWNGGPAHHGGRVIAACNRKIHAEALELLKD